jgi:uncharacterized protein YdaU (DUF1376 family)
VKNPWFPLYVADYLAKTGHLTQGQHGAYLLLLLHYYATRKPIPADRLSLQRICRSFAGYEDTAVDAVLKYFFELRSDGWHNARIDEELEKAELISGARRAAAAKKWGKDATTSRSVTPRGRRLANARMIGTHIEEEWVMLLEICGYKCLKCSAEDVVKDHIVPLYQGGADSIDNLQPLCRSCNSSKGPDRTDYRPENWRELLESACKSTANGLLSQSQSDMESLPIKAITHSKKQFVKPSLEEVSAYCKERKNQVDPAKWLDYYTSNGWHVGRNSMKDWRATVRYWERNGFGGPFDDGHKTSTQRRNERNTKAFDRVFGAEETFGGCE